MGVLQVGFATDVWALGAVLYQLLTGNAPFAGRSDMEVCAGVLARPLLSVRSAAADVPSEVDAIIGRCLEKEPAARWESVAALAQALREAIEDANTETDARTNPT